MNNKQRKEMIVNSIKWATNVLKVRLISGRIQALDLNNVDDKVCCPLGCLLLQYTPEVMDWMDVISQSEQQDDQIDDRQTKAIMNVLAVDDDWIGNFNCGVCGDSYDDYEITNDAAYKMGQQIVKQMKAMTFEDWKTE